MIGIGLVVLWLGYAAFSTGHVNAKGVPVTFSQMVLPKNRAATIALVKAAQGGILDTGNLGPGSLNYLSQPGATVPQPGQKLQ